MLLCVVMCFGVFFSIPAEDMPETIYDESESLPCEMTPVISMAGVQESRSALQVVSVGKSNLPPAPRHNEPEVKPAKHLFSKSLVLLETSLRC